MTTLRRQRIHARLLACGLVLGSGLAPALWLVGHAVAATTEEAAPDHSTGLGIQGFDPVAYFTDGKAKPGRDDLELTHSGVAWRFSNEDNRAAFADDPAVYMPQFGGHDPVGLALGMARAGNPELFAVHDERLFLFSSADTKKAFGSNPDGVALQADANWPHVSRTLAP